MHSPTNQLLFLGLLFVLTSCDLFQARTDFPVLKTKYTLAPRDTSARAKYFNVTVKDPYHWMENNNSEQTRQWVQSQRLLTEEYLGSINFRPEIQSRLAQLWEYEQFGLPFKLGKGMAQFISTDYSQHPILFEVNEYGETGQVLFNPNESLYFDNTYFIKWRFSKGGRFAAAVIQERGAQWQTIIIIDLTTGQTFNEEIIGVKDTEIAWYKSGFYYSKYEENDGVTSMIAPDYFHRVYYHTLGQPATRDEIIYADHSQPAQVIKPITTEDQGYLVLEIKGARRGTHLIIKNLNRRNASFQNLLKASNGAYKFIGKNRNDLYVLTNDNAPNGRLIKTSVRQINKNNWQVVIPESNKVLEEIKLTTNNLVGVYHDDGEQNIQVFDLKGQLKENVDLPAPGTIEAISTNQTEKVAFFQYSSFLQSSRVYGLNLENGTIEIYKSSFTDFESNQFRLRTIQYQGDDDEPVTMYLIHRKGITLDASNIPTLLIGSGGKHDEHFPRYNTTGMQMIPLFLEGGGMVAIPIIRGTSRKGTYWQQSGILRERQKAFDDFQAAADYLIDQGYTSSEKLAAYGDGPTGGLLVMGCAVQRPELFKAVVARGGIYDLLRYHAFTTGWKYADEIGLSEIRQDFDPLWAIDPRRNAISTTYPAILLNTSLSNLEVAPIHSYKLVAELQARQKGKLPILMQLDNTLPERIIHPAELTIKTGADILTFICYQLAFNPIAPVDMIN